MRDKILLIHRINIVVKSKGRKTFPVQIVFFIQNILTASKEIESLSLVTVYYIIIIQRMKPIERNIVKGNRVYLALVLKVAQALVMKENFLSWCCKVQFSVKVK